MQAAIKLINSTLQKHSKHQMLRILKAVALQRSGKLQEGLQVAVLYNIQQHVPQQHKAFSATNTCCAIVLLCTGL